jgi:hypothetical protein
LTGAVIPVSLRRPVHAAADVNRCCGYCLRDPISGSEFPRRPPPLPDRGRANRNRAFRVITAGPASSRGRMTAQFRISDFEFRNAAHPPGMLRSVCPYDAVSCSCGPFFCHPERGRPTAESKDSPTSPENVTELGSLSRLRGSLDSHPIAVGRFIATSCSLGMTVVGRASHETPNKHCHPERARPASESRDPLTSTENATEHEGGDD